MGRALLVLVGRASRQKAVNWIAGAPDGTRLEFKSPRRTTPQNDKMWSMLTEVSQQVEWFGQKYSPDDWKDYMMHALKRARWMPNEDGGMVPIGMRTSDLSVGEMGELIELIYAFGASEDHPVKFAEPTRELEPA